MKKVVAGVFALVVSLGAGCATMTPEEIATEYERQLKMRARASTWTKERKTSFWLRTGYSGLQMMTMPSAIPRRAYMPSGTGKST